MPEIVRETIKRTNNENGSDFFKKSEPFSFFILLLAFFSLGYQPAPKDTTPPNNVTITSPVNNATVSGTVSIIALASDNKGISKVDFYIDNSLKVSDTASPYAYPWDTTKASNGSHSLKVIAYDAAGNNTPSSTISVTVNNALPVPPPAGNELTISSASASGSNSAHPAGLTIDKNPSTYWQGN